MIRVLLAQLKSLSSPYFSFVTSRALPKTAYLSLCILMASCSFLAAYKRAPSSTARCRSSPAGHSSRMGQALGTCCSHVNIAEMLVLVGRPAVRASALSNDCCCCHAGSALLDCCYKALILAWAKGSGLISFWFGAALLTCAWSMPMRQCKESADSG